MLDEFRVLETVVNNLNKARIPYMISGSVAMNYYAQPRMTRDIDIVIELNDAEKFYEFFKQDFYIDLKTIKNSIITKGMFNLIHFKEIVKIDFIIRKDSEFRRTEFERRKKVRINKVEIFIVSIEDLILSKLIWAQNTHSEMQLKDVKNLFGEKVDLKYIRKWARSLRIDNLLKEVLNE